MGCFPNALNHIASCIFINPNSPGGISVRQLAKEIGVNKNTACYMIERIRKATHNEQQLIKKLVEMKS